MHAFDVPASQLVALLGAALALLVASQAMGSLARRLGQARVIGEIGGGLLLGPSVLGACWPAGYEALFAGSPLHGPVLGFLFQLGLLFFMFAAGLESQDFRAIARGRTFAWVALLGGLLPLAAGLGLASWPGWAGCRGEAATPLTFAIFFALCVAATAIPVISKILMDLGLLARGFGRTVLAVAFVEDAALWLAMAALIGNGTAGHEAVVVAITLASFVVILAFGHRLYDALAARLPSDGGPAVLGPVVALLALIVGLGQLGVTPIFGAFLAGHVVAHAERVSEATRVQLKAFAAGLFVPLFFGGVGLRLDLRPGIDLPVLAAVLAGAMAIKVFAVFLGARIAGESTATSLHLGMAMNARGAVGIVLATVGLQARLITPSFHMVLVLTALASTQLAGWWLTRVVRLAPAELDLAAERGQPQPPPLACAGNGLG